MLADMLECNSLWCMKLGIVGFYKRLKQGLSTKNYGIRIIWWTLMTTFLIIVMATMLECRPLQMQELILFPLSMGYPINILEYSFWEPDPLRKRTWKGRPGDFYAMIPLLKLFVVTDPCRTGELHLLIGSILNIATDIMLILYPIPMLWKKTTLRFST